MPRKILIRSTEHPYHITARCINRDWFRVPIDEVWAIFEDYLFFVSHAYGLRIHAFVLMTNHFHLIASTPKGNLDEAMNYLLREISRHITRESGRINQTFGGPYHWTLIDNYHYFLHAYKYVYRNPVEAGLAMDVLQYPYSTLAGRLGFQKMIFQVSDDSLIEDHMEGTLRWLNTGFEESHKEIIRAALTKSKFQIRKDDNGRPHILERQLL